MSDFVNLNSRVNTILENIKSDIRDNPYTSKYAYFEGEYNKNMHDNKIRLMYLPAAIRKTKAPYIIAKAIKKGAAKLAEMKKYKNNNRPPAKEVKKIGISYKKLDSLLLKKNKKAKSLFK